MRRYLLYVGYSGTGFRGIQKQTEDLENKLSSVHGIVENGLIRLCPANTPVIYFSSRTDKGVHAVCNTVHVDLAQHKNGLFYDPNTITYCLNNFFKKSEAAVRVHKTVPVPSSFHARYDAISRTYLYRLGVVQPDIGNSRFAREAFLPTAEFNKIHLVRSPFDIERVIPACHMLEGTHDFATYGAALSKGSFPRETTRFIHKISVTPGRPSLDPCYDPQSSRLQFWDITIKGSSFLYKQVRRTVGALVALAQGRISLDDVKYMLENPSPHNWNSRVESAPPHGLFLLRVEYPQHVLSMENLQSDDDTNKLKAESVENNSDIDVRQKSQEE